MKATLLLPLDLGNQFSRFQARRFARVLLQSLFILVYQLVKKTLLMASCSQNEFISLFFFEPGSYMCSLLFSRLFSPL
jgi:hypothetical protein